MNDVTLRHHLHPAAHLQHGHEHGHDADERVDGDRLPRRRAQLLYERLHGVTLLKVRHDLGVGEILGGGAHDQLHPVPQVKVVRRALGEQHRVESAQRVGGNEVRQSEAISQQLDQQPSQLLLHRYCEP